MTFTHSGPAARACGKPPVDLPGNSPQPGSIGRSLRCGMLAIALSALAGCSAGFDKYFGTDKAPPAEQDPQAKAKTATDESTEDAQEVPGKTGDYPNLGAVPQTRPVRQSAQDQTQALAKGLVADRQNARYTDEVIRRDPVQAAAPARPVIPGHAGGAAPPSLPGAPPAAAAPPSQAAPPRAASQTAAAPSLPAAPPPVAPAPQPSAAAPAAPQAAPPPTGLPALNVPSGASAPPPVAAAPQPAAAPPPIQGAIQPAPQPAMPPLAPVGAPPVAPMAPPPAAPLASAPMAPASVAQPPSVAPVAAAQGATMAAVAQPQFQPPPPPVIPGQPPIGQPAYAQQQAYAQQAYPQQQAALPPAYQQPAAVPQAAYPPPQQPYPQQAYPQQAYPQPTYPQQPYPPQAAYPQAQRPVLIPPPGYGATAPGVPTPSPTAPYAQAPAPSQPPQAVLNPIRPPPAPISPAMPQLASRAGGGFGDPVTEARTRVASAGPNDPASVAEARRRAAFGQGQQVGLILFTNGSASLASADRELLQRVATMAQRNGAVVRVVGHASGRTGELDSMRHQNRNLDISQARASAAAAELNAAGLPVDRIVVEAKGDSEPVYSEAMPSGEAGNRRVDVFLQ